jgi:hypothetical protein
MLINHKLINKLNKEANKGYEIELKKIKTIWEKEHYPECE